MSRFTGPFRIHNHWKLIAVSVVTDAVVFAFGFGFLVLPRYQQRDAPRSTWDSICRALGFQRYRSAQTAGIPAAVVASEVVWSSATVAEAVHGDVARGEFIAINCSACHGAQGVSKRSWVPSLAGMDKLAIYKQLNDFRSEKRLWGVMNGIAQALTESDYADVAAYFSSLTPGLKDAVGTRVPGSSDSLHASDATRRLIFGGDPSRGVAPCAACHGPGGFHLGAPSLQGQHADYIHRQLGEFVQGVRTNDINEPMRTIAGKLTDEEMVRVAEFYGAGLAPDSKQKPEEAIVRLQQ
jgi:cytochrome c553